ncbi:MAG TPA: FKBP-type peptidyl-prolyl cis-trans isomerase [Steroidobacteraceae bacterium]|nr:FKBP-type peptidyl-prolyl cis-trans isomerase [Steroidobacteraceae bacterium]
MSKHALSGALTASVLFSVIGAAPTMALPPTNTLLAQRDPNPTPSPAPPAIAPADGSYDVGLMIGSQLANSGLGTTISREALSRGIEAALGGKLPSAAQRDTAQQFMHAARVALAGRNSELAKTFLEKNAREKGVATLPSGLQYRVLAEGNPKAPLPGPQDQIIVRYRASLADGTEIDRSDEHTQPAAFKLNSVIKGWREALSAMRPGAKWQVFVPPDLGYGANSPPSIPPGSLLVYELELLQVDAAKPMSPEMMKPRQQRPAQSSEPKSATP